MSRDKVSNNEEIFEDAPVNNVGSGAIAGAGVGPMGEPGVSVKAQRKRYGKTQSTPTPVIINMLRRKVPSQLAEVSQKLANSAYAQSKETSDTFNNLMGGGTRTPDYLSKKLTRTDRLKSHIARKWGEKGVKKAEKHADDHFYDRLDEDLETFAGSVVFEVSSKIFHLARNEKRSGKHWRKYLDEDDCFADIREYAHKNPKRGIVLRNESTGEMCYARYPKKRG